MQAAGYPVAALQGNMSQNARDQVMADFRSGKIAILLATNVAARGIDVTAVDHVINFELPESSELLQHRIGRTGRMGKAGSAITLLSDEDADKWRQLDARSRPADPAPALDQRPPHGCSAARRGEASRRGVEKSRSREVEKPGSRGKRQSTCSFG